MKVVTFNEANNKLKTVVDRVVDDADYTVIVREDGSDAVIMSLEYFNSLLTVHPQIFVLENLFIILNL